MKFLLDTNTCIAAMRNRASVVERMTALTPRDLAISTITSFELFTGIAKCTDPDKERAKVDLLLATLTQLPFDELAAQEAARTRALLEAKGQKIGPYDILIAGQALAGKLTLVTANTGEFSRIPGLVLENWLTSTSTS